MNASQKQQVNKVVAQLGLSSLTSKTLGISTAGFGTTASPTSPSAESESPTAIKKESGPDDWVPPQFRKQLKKQNKAKQ